MPDRTNSRNVLIYGNGKIIAGDSRNIFQRSYTAQIRDYQDITSDQGFPAPRKLQSIVGYHILPTVLLGRFFHVRLSVARLSCFILHLLRLVSLSIVIQNLRSIQETTASCLQVCSFSFPYGVLISHADGMPVGVSLLQVYSDPFSDAVKLPIERKE